MKELVGTCVCCGKEIFCLDGFLNGVSDTQKLYCFDCHENNKTVEENPQK